MLQAQPACLAPPRCNSQLVDQLFCFFAVKWFGVFWTSGHLSIHVEVAADLGPPLFQFLYLQCEDHLSSNIVGRGPWGCLQLQLLWLPTPPPPGCDDDWPLTARLLRAFGYPSTFLLKHKILVAIALDKGLPLYQKSFKLIHFNVIQQMFTEHPLFVLTDPEDDTGRGTRRKIIKIIATEQRRKMSEKRSGFIRESKR